jgi:hypothetical protein
MFESVKRLYEKYENKTIVKNAVLKCWLTAEDYQLITGDELTA